MSANPNERNVVMVADRYSFEQWRKAYGVPEKNMPYERWVSGIFKNHDVHFLVRSFWHVRVKGQRTCYVAVKYVAEDGSHHMTIMHQIGVFPRKKFPRDYVALEPDN